MTSRNTVISTTEAPISATLCDTSLANPSESRPNPGAVKACPARHQAENENLVPPETAVTPAPTAITARATQSRKAAESHSTVAPPGRIISREVEKIVGKLRLRIHPQRQRRSAAFRPCLAYANSPKPSLLTLQYALAPEVSTTAQLPPQRLVCDSGKPIANAERGRGLPSQPASCFSPTMTGTTETGDD
jgi:hypothetical protein